MEENALIPLRYLRLLAPTTTREEFISDDVASLASSVCAVVSVSWLLVISSAVVGEVALTSVVPCVATAGNFNACGPSTALVKIFLLIVTACVPSVFVASA